MAPPARVESTNTRPPRSALTNSVVARSGSSRAVRAASARVAPATSSKPCDPSSGTNTWIPLAPLVFTAAPSPQPSSTSRTSSAVRAARAKPAGPSRSPGGSRSITRWLAWSEPSGTIAGWYSTARWLASQTRVRRSSHSGYRTSRFEACAHTSVCCTQSGAYDGRFFCMNGFEPGRTRTTDSARPASPGRIRSRTPSR